MIILTGIILVVLSTAFFVISNNIITNKYGESLLGSVFHLIIGGINGVFIVVVEYFFEILTKKIVDNENHKYQSKWDNSYIIKVHYFNFAFHYFTLLYYGLISNNYTLLLSNYIPVVLSKSIIFLMMVN